MMARFKGRISRTSSSGYGVLYSNAWCWRKHARFAKVLELDQPREFLLRKRHSKRQATVLEDTRLIPSRDAREEPTDSLSGRVLNVQMTS